jgi:diketogulonate reductase-like aldo/keto reductase
MTKRHLPPTGSERSHRRRFLGGLAAMAGGALLPGSATAADGALVTRAVPSTGERLPVIGLGSWITFNVGDDRVARDACADVMRNFFAAGGRIVDSSPMYGSSQAVIGYGLAKLGTPATLFSADKVWIAAASRGAAQVEASRGHWGVSRFDLLQVHNLLAWQDHLPMLFVMKQAGRLRYVGITTSEGRRHRDVEQIMRREPLDFVQVTYNPVDREVEARILPLARERGIAVIVNRPFQQGTLIDAVSRHPLPAWAAEIGCVSWAQVLLKFVVSHPAVTCAIPATTRVAHVRENMGAARGVMPDEAIRRRIVAHVERLQ